MITLYLLPWRPMSKSGPNLCGWVAFATVTWRDGNPLHDCTNNTRRSFTVRSAMSKHKRAHASCLVLTGHAGTSWPHQDSLSVQTSALWPRLSHSGSSLHLISGRHICLRICCHSGQKRINISHNELGSRNGISSISQLCEDVT